MSSESLERLVKSCDTEVLSKCLRDPINATNSVQAERNKFVIAAIQAELARRQVITYSWNDLAEAMRARGNKKFTFNGVTGYVKCIEREDGSGTSFNIFLEIGNDVKEVHVYVRD